MTITLNGALAAGLALALLGSASPAFAVKKETKTINGLKVDLYSWKDSAGFKRSVALKKEGSGNPDHGGYAVQMTAEDIGPTLVANAPKGDGFGYFVSHERYRTFSDGDSATIAGKIFGKDDSPLGRGFAVKTSYGADDKKFKSVTFSLTYPRYGTKKAGDINTDTGEDKPAIGTKKKLFDLYDLPVQITWSFEDGRSFPRIRTVVDLSKIPGPDRVSFDVRGPYGKLDFDQGANPISKVTWGDRFHFVTTSAPLKRSSTWTWNQANDGARYNSILAGDKEMGLLEPKPYANSALNDGFAFGRGKTFLTHDAADAGCPGQELPCDYEWAYQSSQYELPADVNGTTTSEKLAWGSTPFYGMKAVPATYDGTASTPFNGFPNNKKIVYDVCVVLGQQVGGGLARFTAEGGGAFDCAKAD